MFSMKSKFSFNQDIILENDRALLKPLSKDDYDDYWRISQKDPGLLKYSPALINTPELLENYIQTALDLRENNEKYSFTIIDKSKNTIVGSTSFMNISTVNKSLEIGSTWLDPDTQGTGLNRQNKLLMLAYAFEEIEFERVELKTDSRNLQSRKAILKIGAQYEGCLRSHMLMSDGYRRHTIYYSIIKKEWPSIKTHLEN